MKTDDESLVESILAGDNNAFAELVDRYKGIVWSLAYGACGNIHDAEDLAQEAFLRAYVDLADLIDPCRFPSWLYRIALNVCRAWLRRTGRPQAKDVADLDSWWGADAQAADAAEAESAEMRSQVMAAVNGLSPRNRLAVILYYIGVLKQREVAELLGLSAG